VTPSPLAASEPNFDHLVRMTDAHGTFEHAQYAEPRPEHGYCTDDMARVLVVTTREPAAGPEVRELAALSLRFMTHAVSAGGGCRNRMSRRGRWEDRPTLNDCWGRSIWGFGTAVSHSDDEQFCRLATEQFERAARQRSTWPRAMAFAALGAAEVLSVRPDNGVARALLTDAADAMAGSTEHTDRTRTRTWPWPEPRLTYANAALPEAMIAAGVALERPGLLRQGLGLLEWLLDHEMQDGHVSVTPVGGAGPGDRGPGFDQQPIEVAALADACARASRVDSDRRWPDGLSAAVAWFLGGNDRGVVMWDPTTGGGFDGLEDGGANLNQGAESTLALLATLQHARSLVAVLQ
jgi:hypothetical protein